jgi:hypothetical protein
VAHNESGTKQDWFSLTWQSLAVFAGVALLVFYVLALMRRDVTRHWESFKQLPPGPRP